MKEKLNKLLMEEKEEEMKKEEDVAVVTFQPREMTLVKGQSRTVNVSLR